MSNGPSSDIHERLRIQRQQQEDAKIKQLKSSATITTLTPDQVIQRLRWPEGSPTTYELLFTQLFSETFPEAKGNIASYQKNSNCGCRRSLISLVALKMTEVNALLAKVYGGVIYQVQNIIAPASASSVANADKAVVAGLAGKTALIEPTTQAYQQYFKALKTHPARQYNGVSVMPTKDANGEDKWALLFW